MPTVTEPVTSPAQAPWRTDPASTPKPTPSHFRITANTGSSMPDFAAGAQERSKTGILDKKLERNSSNIENQTRNRSDQGEADDPGNQATVPQPSDLARACFLPAASSLIGALCPMDFPLRALGRLLASCCMLAPAPRPRTDNLFVTMDH